MADKSKRSDPLLDHLVNEGVILGDQLTEVLDEHNRTSRPVHRILLDQSILTEDELLQHVATVMGCEVIDLASMPIEESTYRLIPPSTAKMYNVVPVERTTTGIQLAVGDIPAPEVEDELKWLLNTDITFVVARPKAIEDHILKHYGDDNQSVNDILSALETAGEGGIKKDEELSSDELQSAASQAPVVRFVNLVLYQAVQDRASDIHFEPFEHEFRIRYRVDGALYEMAPPPKHLALPVISRVKVISGLDISERRLPQDGRIQLNIGGKSVDFRVSTLPTQFGESVVLRVLDQSAIGLKLENLGMPQDVAQWFGDDIVKPNGIILVTGPTGSGKTTTLYAALDRLNTVGDKLLTAEDPVEYDVDGIVQVPVDEKIGVTFARILRAFLRQDPDIILVGEIRDLETAQIAIQASLTGHLVFSTLHTNDASGAVTRLVDMNIEPFLIASTLEAILGTRLVRTICKNCRTPYTPDDNIIKLMGLTRADVGDRPFYYGAGCPTCNQTGYKGRRGIYEYLRMSDPIRELVVQKRPTVVIRDKARQLGMRTLREDGVRCVLDGYTTVEEILKYT